MANGTPTGSKLYELLLNAKNCKMIFLSGTPIINTIFELTEVYNLLMGPVSTLVYKLIPEFGKNINYSIIKDILSLIRTLIKFLLIKFVKQ